MQQTIESTLADWWMGLVGFMASFFAAALWKHLKDDAKVERRVAQLEVHTPTRTEVKEDITELRENLTQHITTRCDNIAGHVESVHDDVKTLIRMQMEGKE